MILFPKSKTPLTKTKTKLIKQKRKTFRSSFSVPYNVLFSNQFLEDLDKIWELRHWIPDPNKIEFSNCRCTPTSRFRG